MKRCMYCGQVNDDTNDACFKCGNPLLDAPMDDQQLEEVGADENLNQKRHMGTDGFDEDYAEEDLSDDDLEEDDLLDDEPNEAPVGRVPGRAPAAGQDEEYASSYEEEYPYDEDMDERDYVDDEDYPYSSDSRSYDDDYDTYDEYGDRQTMTPFMLKARKRVKSFLFFLPTLFFTVYFVAQVLNLVLGSALVNLSTVTNTIEKQFGSGSALVLAKTGIAYLNNTNRFIVMGAGLGLMLPELLLLFGLWGMFAKTSRRYVSMSTSGYTLTSVAMILRFIMVIAVLLGAIVLAVSFVVAAGASGSTMSLIVGIVLLLVVVILAVLVIMFYVQVIFSIKVTKRNTKLGEDIGSIPGYAIFCGFVMTALHVAMLLPMAADDYIGLAAGGAKALWLLFITLWAIVYKATVKHQH